MSYDPTSLQRSMFNAMRTTNAMQTSLENALRASKSDAPPAHGKSKALGALALLAGARKPGGPGEQIAVELARGLIGSFVNRLASGAKDPVIFPGSPPLTRSTAAAFNLFFAQTLNVKLRSSEARVLEALLEELWKRGVQEEIASVLTLLEYAGSSDAADSEPTAAQSLTEQFLALPWCQPFLFWAHGVTLRWHYIGESVDPELQQVLNESEKLKKEVEKLSQDLNRSREKERNTSQELDRTRSEWKAAVGEQSNLRKRLDEIFSAASVPEINTVEHRLRVALVRRAKTGLLVDPHVPAKKIVNARLECQVPAEERVLALLDLTLFGSAKDAVVFGTDGIYHHSGPARCAVLYSELAGLTTECSPLGVKFASPAGQVAERNISILGSGYPPDQFHLLVTELGEAYTAHTSTLKRSTA